MLPDAEPVRFEEMRVGMQFERAITQEQCDDIADFIDGVQDEAKKAARLVQ